MKKFTTKRLAIITSDALNEILDAKYSGITQVVNAQEILANPLIGALREDGLTAREAKNTAKELIEALGHRARCKSYNEALEDIVNGRNARMLEMYNNGEVPILVKIMIAVPSIKGTVLVGPFKFADYSLLPIVVTTSQPEREEIEELDAEEIEDLIAEAIAEVSGEKLGTCNSNGPNTPKLRIKQPFTKRQIRSLQKKLVATGLFKAQDDAPFIEESPSEFSIFIEWLGAKDDYDWLVGIDQDGKINIDVN